MITSSQKDLSDWSRDSKKFKIGPTSIDTCAVCSYAEKKKKEREKVCRDQDSNLGYYGHNVMS